MFGDLFRLASRQGPMSHDAARQLAISIATDGVSEPNVTPHDRIRIEQLARVAELQVANATGLSCAGGGITFVPVTRTQWIQHTLDAYGPLFEDLSAAVESDVTTMSSDPGESGFGVGDPLGWLAPLMKMMGPMMLGMITGSMIGRLAKRSFGQYDLPIPRPPSDELLIVPSNMTRFGSEWSLEEDDLTLWICLHEVAHHLVLSIPHVRDTIDSMLHEYLTGFEAAGTGLEDRLGELDLSDVTDSTDVGSMFDLERMFGDPEILLGAIRSDAQREMLPRFEAIVCALVGYVDHVMDRIGHGLISSYGMVTEALRRRRVEADPSDRFVERLFGLELTQTQYDRGASFVAGIIDRAGEQGLARLWESVQTLPTPAELDAPGLWLARIDLPDP